MSQAFIADRCSCGNYKRKRLEKCTVCSNKERVSAYGMSAGRLATKVVQNMTFDEAKAQNMVKEWKETYPALAELEGRN